MQRYFQLLNASGIFQIETYLNKNIALYLIISNKDFYAFFRVTLLSSFYTITLPFTTYL